MGTRATSLTLFPRRFGTSATHADPIGHRGLGTPLGGPFRQKATSNRVAYDGSELLGSSLFVLSRHVRESARSGESQNTFWDICLAVSPKWGKHPSKAMHRRRPRSSPGTARRVWIGPAKVCAADPGPILVTSWVIVLVVEAGSPTRPINPTSAIRPETGPAARSRSEPPPNRSGCPR